MSKASSLRKTDVLLMVTFPLLFVSALFLHAAGHNPDTADSRPWLLIHMLAGIFFIVFSTRHIVQHWGWFKTLFKTKNHSIITILTAFSFIFVAITGIVLVIVEHYWDSSHFQAFHAQTGLLFSIFAVWHCLKRIKAFRKLNGVPL